MNRGVWECLNCGNIEHIEREVRCWKCGIGEMVYLGREIGVFICKILRKLKIL